MYPKFKVGEKVVYIGKNAQEFHGKLVQIESVRSVLYKVPHYYIIEIDWPVSENILIAEEIYNSPLYQALL